MSRAERTGWRDAALSQRHRAWGAHCPALDLDFVLVELDRAEPVALIDYKLGRPRALDLDIEVGLRALARLADRADLPAFVTWYAAGAWVFRVVALNELARPLALDRDLDEPGYVGWLHDLRDREAPAGLLARLRECAELRAA